MERYWLMQATPDDGHPEPFGEGTTWAVVDEEAGGVIAYAGRENAQRISDALYEMEN